MSVGLQCIFTKRLKDRCDKATDSPEMPTPFTMLDLVCLKHYIRQIYNSYKLFSLLKSILFSILPMVPLFFKTLIHKANDLSSRVSQKTMLAGKVCFTNNISFGGLE